MLDDLLREFQQRDRRALSQLISTVARGESLARLRKLGHQVPSQAVVVAITGSAGVGKSTVIGALVALLRQMKRTVAVFACDPQSPLTGGALLGDRIRITDATQDDGVYVRSLPVPGGQQSIAENLGLMIELTKAFGFEFVIVETVGAGQGDTAIRAIADVVVLLIQPESGDELQWQKAGILEIADIVVVQKSDLAGSDRLESELREQLDFPAARKVIITRTAASRGLGVAELLRFIETQALPEATGPDP